MKLIAMLGAGAALVGLASAQTAAAEIKKSQGLFDAAVAKCNVDVAKDWQNEDGSWKDMTGLQGAIKTYFGLRCFPKPASGSAYCDEYWTYHWAGLYIESCPIGGTDNGCMVPNYGDTADTASACLTALTAAVSGVPKHTDGKHMPAPGGPAGSAMQTKFDAMWVACYTGADHLKQALSDTIVFEYCGTIPVVTGDGSSGSPYVTDGTPVNPQPTTMPTVPFAIGPSVKDWPMPPPPPPAPPAPSGAATASAFAGLALAVAAIVA